MEKVYNVTDFADMIGKSVKTLQKWDRDGRLRAYRSPAAINLCFMDDYLIA